ncbi:MAG: hypothetical protein ABFD64_00250 [Armatimonadota bacterium]
MKNTSTIRETETQAKLRQQAWEAVCEVACALKEIAAGVNTNHKDRQKAERLLHIIEAENGGVGQHKRQNRLLGAFLWILEGRMGEADSSHFVRPSALFGSNIS